MTKSTTAQGIPASAGVAAGEARMVYAWDNQIRERRITPSEVSSEVQKVDQAVQATIDELTQIRDSAGRTMGGPAAKIFDAQLLIAGDFEFLKSVKDEIAKRQVNAEAVYSQLIAESTRPLRQSSDPYMRQMLNDIEAVSRKALAHMSGENNSHEYTFPPNTIVVARSLTPAETLRLYEQGVAGVVTAEGSAHSHMALIARSLYLPAVVGVERIQNKIRNGMRLIVDGGLGKVFIEPDDSQWKSYKERTRGDALGAIKQISELASFPPKTTDGHIVTLAANIELPGARDKALSDRKVGVGLYRTEFIYLQSNHFPDEEAQFEYYDSIASEYAPQTVVMRTFDLGSDKYVEELQSIKESNPALGWRGIRMSLGMPKIFNTQIRALLRASARKNIRILLPMLSDISELQKAERAIKRGMVELRRKKIAFDPNVPIGVMIESPSAALTAERFAERAAFLAIGTNDLIQYTLAVDRDNERVADLYRMFHPSVLKLIKMTIDAGKEYDRPVSVCGEMAGVELAQPLLIGLGATSLSMDPTRIYKSARLIGALSLKEMKAHAEEMLDAKTVRETEKIANSFFEKIQKKIGKPK